MSNLKNESFQINGGKPRSYVTAIILVGLVVVAALALAPTLLGLADAGGVKAHTFDVTFTKWVTTAPHMEGIVGGAVGDGTFAGEISSMASADGITNIGAVYHVNGSEHSFSANIEVKQDDSAGTGSITGEISEGWLKGRSLTGEYKVLAQCPIATAPAFDYYPSCFQGTLHIPAAP